MPKTKRLVWDQTGEHLYETGIDHGVLYLRDQQTGKYDNAHPWNGLTTVTESPSGADDNAFYADNIKYLNLKGLEEFGLTVECYTFPDAFMLCDGTAEISEGVFIGQQPRQTFGMSYRTRIGNDIQLDAYGYKLHLVYGCSASPSERGYQTVNDSPEPIAFSYEISTTPVTMEGHSAVSIITIDSTKVDKEKLKKLEDALYGTDAEEDGIQAYLPLPEEVKNLFETGDFAKIANANPTKVVTSKKTEV